MKRNSIITSAAILIALITILTIVIFFPAPSSDVQSSSQLQKSDTFNIARALQNSALETRNSPIETANPLQNSAPQNQTRPFDVARPIQNTSPLPTFENTAILNLNVGEYRGDFTWTDWIVGVGTLRSLDTPNNITPSYLETAVDTLYKTVDSGQPSNNPTPFSGVLPPVVYDPTMQQQQSPQ